MVDKSVFFREVTLHITGRLELDLALRDLFQYLKKHMPLSILGAFYLDEETHELRMLGRIFESNGKAICEKSDTLIQAPDDLMAFLTNRLKQFRNMPSVEIIQKDKAPDSHPLLEKTFGYLRQYDLMEVRLKIGDTFLGGILLCAEPPSSFSAIHAELMEHVLEPIAIAFSNARRYEDLLKLKNTLLEDNRAISKDLYARSSTSIVGAETGLRNVMDMARHVAPMGSPVLLLGETGTGKEVLAHEIHSLSRRANQPFVRVQCGAIPETLLESELFGHEKGAFTGAVAQKRGRFERAHEGTIFLDEIGELSLEAQVKLLGVLQQKEFERLGGNKVLKVDVRVIAATNQNLEEMVKERRFREDLWFRLNVFPILLPSLKERKDDIPLLVSFFVTRKCQELSLPRPKSIEPEAIDRLMEYDWPGNVRELQNVVERALILTQGSALDFPNVPNRSETMRQSVSSYEKNGEMLTLDEIFVRQISLAMEEAGGRIQGAGGAAELLGIAPNTLRARMRKLSLPYGRKAKWKNSKERRQS